MSVLGIIYQREKDQDGIRQRNGRDPYIILLTNLEWGIENISETNSSRVYQQSTYQGFQVRRLPREPTEMRIKLKYFPWAREHPYPWPWYAPLDVLKNIQGTEVDLRLFSRRLKVGSWILTQADFELSYIVQIPRVVDVQLRFLEIDRSWPAWNTYSQSV